VKERRAKKGIKGVHPPDGAFGLGPKGPLVIRVRTVSLDCVHSPLDLPALDALRIPRRSVPFGSALW